MRDANGGPLNTEIEGPVLDIASAGRWVRMAVGKKVDRNGNAMTVKYKCEVEPYWR